MIYITVQEASDKWGIGTRRICILCKNGRIPGAQKKSNIWMIPESARKPEDPRSKNSKGLQHPILLLYNTVHDLQEQGVVLSREEREICELQEMFFGGNLEGAYAEIIRLLGRCKNERYLGVLFFLKLIIVADLGMPELYLATLRDMKILFAESGGSPLEQQCFNYFNDSIELLDYDILYSEDYVDIIPFFCLLAAKKGINELIQNNLRKNIVNYNIICMELERKGVPIISGYYHIYLAVYLNAVGEKTAYNYHIRRAASILLPRGYYVPLAEYSATIDLEFIREIDEEAYRKISFLSRKVIRNYIKLGIFDDCNINPRMDKTLDIRIGYKIAQGKTNEEIAKELGISQYKVRKHVEELYTLFGTNSKRELQNFILKNFSL